MIRSLLVVTSMLSLGACASRYDVTVAWTLDGQAAGEACKSLPDSDVGFRLDQRDTESGPVVEEDTTAKCALGKATIQSAAFSTMFVRLLENVDGAGAGDEYGSSGPIDLSPGGQTASYAGTINDPILADIHLTRGKLHTRLTVGGADCGKAGASDFTVTVRDNSSPLGEDVVVDGKTVTCDAATGVAAFDFEPVDNGSRYDVVATTTINGQSFATSPDGIGAGAVASGAVTEIVADLSPIN